MTNVYPFPSPIGQPDPMDPQRCRARNRAGAQCGNRPIVGGRVCRMHGGAAPQTKRAAAMRLAELEAPAVAQLAKLLLMSESDAVRLRAVTVVLDRTGHPPGILVGVTPAEEAREQLLQLMIEAQVDDDL